MEFSWSSKILYLWLVVYFLHDVEFWCVEDAVNIDIIGAEDTFARFGRVRLTVNLSVVQVDLVGVVGLQVELTLADETFKAGLVVDISLDRTDSFERIDLIAASETLVL